MSHRKERFASTLKQCLADILREEMGDPLFKSVFISGVTVSADLRRAGVFVSSVSLPGSADTDKLINRLSKAKGFIKRALAKRMYLKYMPDFEFIKDGPLVVKTGTDMELNPQM